MKSSPKIFYSFKSNLVQTKAIRSDFTFKLTSAYEFPPSGNSSAAPEVASGGGGALTSQQNV